MELPKKLFNRNYLLLWQGQSVSRLGNHVFSVAMMLWITQTTNSASLIGLLGMVAGVPAVLLGIIGGTIADRYSRRKIIILSDVFNGIFILVLAGFFFFMSHSTETILFWLFVASIGSAMVSAFFQPAISASIPDLVPEKSISKANTLGQLSDQIAMFFGQSIGAVLFHMMGAPLLVLFNGITFLFSAVSEFFIKIPQHIPKRKEKFDEKLTSFREDFLEGFRFVWRASGLKKLVLASVFMTFFSIPIILLLPFYVKDFLRVESYWYGFILSAYGVGTMLGYFIAGFLSIKGAKRASLTTKFMVLDAFAYGFLVLIQSPWAATGLAMMGGVFSGFISINIITILQITTPSPIRGRVFGFLATFSGGVAPLGMGLSGIIADLTGKNIPVIYVTCSLIIGCVAIIVALSRDTCEFLSYEKKDEERQIDEMEKVSCKSMQYLENGNAYKGLRLLNKALMKDRNHTLILYCLGLINFKLEMYDETLWHLTRLLRINRENQDALLLGALIYSQKNNFQKTEEFLKKLIGVNPAHKTALLDLAVLYKNQGKHFESTELLNEYIQFYPECPLGYIGLAQNYTKLKMLNDVDSNLERAMELNGNKRNKDLLNYNLFTSIMNQNDLLIQNKIMEKIKKKDNYGVNPKIKFLKI